MNQSRDSTNDAASVETDRSTSQGWLERRQRVAANIERVALLLFVERGYAAVTIEEVAKAAGCSVRTVTRQFAAKEDLLLGFHRRKNQAVLDEFSRLAPGTDPIRAIWEVWMNMAERSRADLRNYLAWMKVAAAVPELTDRVNGERRRKLQEALRALISASPGHDEASTELRSHVLAGILEAANAAVVDYWLDRNGIDEFRQLYQSAVQALAELSDASRSAGHGRARPRARKARRTRSVRPA